MQGRFFRLLLVSLMGFSCSLFEAEELPPQWVEASLYGAPPLRDILSECESALQASNFPLPFHRDDLERAVVSGWDVAPHPFSRKGMRSRGIFEVNPLEKGAWLLRVRVEVEKNDEVHQPLELDSAKWKPMPDDAEVARIVLQHALTRLRRVGTRIG